MPRPTTGSARYRINVLSAVQLIQRFVPPMRERGWGRVIQIGGGLAQQPSEAYPHYGAALAAATTSPSPSRASCKNTGVTSNVVAPGAIRVPMLEELLTKVAENFDWGDTWDEIESGAVRDIAPNDIGRFGTPEEVGFRGRVPRKPLGRLHQRSGPSGRRRDGQSELLTPMRTWDQGNTPRSAIR